MTQKMAGYKKEAVLPASFLLRKEAYVTEQIFGLRACKMKIQYQLTFVWRRIILFAIEYFRFSVPCKFNAKGATMQG